MERALFTAEENEQLDELASTLVDEYMEMLDSFQFQPLGGLHTDWKLLVQREDLDVYTQRQQTRSLGLCGGEDYPDAGDDTSAPRLLATGSLHATLDDVMFASVTPTDGAMRVRMEALASSDVTGLVLHTVTEPEASQPFRFTCVKWLLRRAPSILRGVVRARDFVFLEATGVRVRHDGERIGYHLRHSLDFATTTRPSNRGAVRGTIASCRFYRELAPCKLDVWAFESLDLSGSAWQRLATAEACRDIESILELPTLALSKKLLWFAQLMSPSAVGYRHSRSPSPATPRLSPRHRRTARRCYNCSATSSWLWETLPRCAQCGLCVCTQCSEPVVLVAPRLSQRCCLGCVLSMNDGNRAVYASQCRQAEPRHHRAPPVRSSASATKPFRASQQRRPQSRTRTLSTESASTFTSSMASVLSTADVVPREPSTLLETETESSRRRRVLQRNLVDTLARLQVVADATYAAQCAQGELYVKKAVSRHAGRW